MKRVIIVHRWEGGSHDDWYPWLKSEFEKLGYEVQVPNMPDTEVPIIKKWVDTLTEIVGTPDINTYFIGHSIGCQAILRYLETINTPVGGAIFVAGWFNLENIEDEEAQEIARPWIEIPINLVKVKSILPKATLIISENDPYGCLEENQQKFSKVTTNEIVISNAGHFTSEDGYIEIPEVIDELVRFMANLP
ncbi:MAG: alpha/beta hydrolase [Candidatus Pacebacteria bacterium]|nr:alpha/beta hydrolase [Candidatus Paceibacterota bacterium]MCF7862573.1 alpha/beta hydrolase [Candidatus Paceibacterota bacterium]